MIHEERVEDITKTLDKTLVRLLFGSIGAFIATVFLAKVTGWLPGWVSIVGITVAILLLIGMAALGVVLTSRREQIYRKWFSKESTGKPCFRTLTGEVVKQTRRDEATYEITIKVDGDKPDLRISELDDVANVMPKVGERVTVVTSIYYGKDHRELLRRITLYRGAGRIMLSA